MRVLDRASTIATLPLVSPHSGRPLVPVGPNLLAAGDEHWPVVDGIPFLRPDREALRLAAVAAVARGDTATARRLLLQDQDDWAPLPPPSDAAVDAVVDAVARGAVGARQAMVELNFGPVADYFAHRWSTPTFLAGLGLLAQHWHRPSLVVELACGLGQLLREPVRRGVPGIGIDLVYAKLWLARHFVFTDAAAPVQLVCGDAGIPPLGEGDDALVLCHDALYFFAARVGGARGCVGLAGRGGRVVFGHAHSRAVDHGGVGGHPWTPAAYAELLPGAVLYDDAELAAALLANAEALPRSPAALAAVEAVALAWRGPEAPAWGYLDLGQPPPTAPLVLNPLLAGAAPGEGPRWPTARLAAEYADTPYLRLDRPLEPAALARAAAGSGDDPALRDWARRRVLLDCPRGW